MAVHVDNLGLSGSGRGRRFCPPEGTQVQIFEDDFHRRDADTLGTKWGNLWCYADFPYHNPGGERPGSYDAAANPRISNNRCQWFIRRDDDDRSWAFSIAWPWPLAWMTQGKFDQFVEIEVASQHSGTQGGICIGCVFSGALGSLEPDRYGQHIEEPAETFYGQYGTYYSGRSAAVYGLFGGNPSATPDGLRGHAGINYLALAQVTPPEVDYPFVMRQETRWVSNTWEIRVFLNGEETIRVTDHRLLQGQPCLIYLLNADSIGMDMDNLVQVSRFSAGLIGGVPPSPPPVIFPPVGSQLADFSDDFRRPYNLNVPPKNGDSLGPLWAVQWLTADSARVEEEEERSRINRVNPSILNGQCAFRAKLPNAPATTACFPLPLSWMVVDFYSQYAQLRMRQKPAEGIWQAFVLAAYSAWPGTRHYDPGITAQSGFFGLTFGPSSNPNATSTELGLWAMATTPESRIEGQSLELLQRFRTLPDAPLGTLKRLEAIVTPVHDWLLRVFFDGVQIAEVNVGAESVHGSLGQSLPAMACSIGGYGVDDDEEVPIVLVDDFRAGWLR